MAAQGPLGSQEQSQAGEITSQIVQQGIISMKKALSQIEGECATMRGDAQSNIFANMANVCSRLLQQAESLKQTNKGLNDTLEKIYQAHPEIKIANEKQKPKPPKSIVVPKPTGKKA